MIIKNLPIFHFLIIVYSIQTPDTQSYICMISAVQPVFQRIKWKIIQYSPALLFLQKLKLFYGADFSRRSIASTAEPNSQQVGKESNSKDHQMSNEKVLQSTGNQRKSAGNIFLLSCLFFFFLNGDVTQPQQSEGNFCHCSVTSLSFKDGIKDERRTHIIQVTV